MVDALCMTFYNQNISIIIIGFPYKGIVLKNPLVSLLKAYLLERLERLFKSLTAIDVRPEPRMLPLIKIITIKCLHQYVSNQSDVYCIVFSIKCYTKTAFKCENLENGLH